jgi:ABC-type transport system involved in multi-copper enzyme maturation permease subunit
MKFLAILRDSLREAIDTMVFYVMVALSLLLTLFAFSIGFQPLPARQALESFANLTLNPQLPRDADPQAQLSALIRMTSQGDTYEVAQAEPLDDGRAPFDTRYQVILVRKAINATVGGKATPKAVQQRVKDQFGRLGELPIFQVAEVKELAADDPRSPGGLHVPGTSQMAFEVTIAPTPDTQLFWPHNASILFGLVPIRTGAPLGFQLHFIESGLVIGLGGWVTILISVIITAFFIPNMMRKGTVDLLLVKPISRPALLIYKFIGGLTFIFLNTAVAVGGVWLALSLRSGVWATGFLWTILIITFFFAILYTVSTLFGMLTQSPIAAILLTCGAWFFLFMVGIGYQFAEAEKAREQRSAKQENREPEPEGTFFQVVRGVHFVLPRTSDLGLLNSRLLSNELISADKLSGKPLDQTSVTWAESLTVSAVFIVLVLGLACWRFSVRDY